MALIDDLLEQVADEQLRRRLTEAVAGIRSKEKFGLVFEEHVPETVLLPGVGVRVGATVMLRKAPKDKTRYVVTAVAGGTATVTPSGGGKAQDVPIAELLVVKSFGEPVYPVLRPAGAVARGGDKPYHAVINGENFHAVQLALYAYEGQVDVLYLDPPYNTGARDWKYNNNYVDNKDTWRHSKWLSMMDKRLRLAKQLLKPGSGILIVTIDEHEVHHLGMLLEDIFDEYLRHMVTIVINPKGTGKVNFGRVDEYASFVIPDTGDSLVELPGSVPSLGTEGEDEIEADADAVAGDEDEADGVTDEADGAPDEQDEEYPFAIEDLPLWERRHARRRGGESSYRAQRPNQFYPLWVDVEARKVVQAGRALASIDEQPSFEPQEGLTPIWPIDSEGNHRCWRYIPESMQKLIDEGRVVLGRYNAKQDTWTVNYWVRKATTKKPKTVWWETRHDAGTHGTTLLSRLLGRRAAFNFPKSVYAVADCLALCVRNNPDALIVDFFAGSGTTLHATAMLNAADGGRRRCVLVTNNDVDEKTAKKLNAAGLYLGDADFDSNGICTAVTIPRVRAALTGVQAATGKPLPGKYLDGRPLSDGFDENAVFFDMVYADPDALELGSRFDDVAPVLWLAAGGVGALDAVKVVDGSGWVMPQGSPLAVLLDEDRIRPFLTALGKQDGITHVWLVTDSEPAFARMRARISGDRTVGMLYRDYLRNFQTNAEAVR